MFVWSAWLHSDGTGMHYVMIRNHKTSRCLVTFQDKAHAEQQTRKLNAYRWERLAELYRSASANNILTIKDHDLDFKSNKLSPIEIQKGEACYGLVVWANGKQYVVAKKKYKYEIQDVLKTMRQQYTDEQIVDAVRRKVSTKTTN